MSARPAHVTDAAHNSTTGAGAATTINLPPLRTRQIVLDHSLASQWRGTAGRSHKDDAFVTDKQRLLVLLALFVVSALLIAGTLHFTHPRVAHPGANLSHANVQANPHMLRQYNKLMNSASGQAAQAAAAAVGIVTSPPASATASAYSVLYVTVPTAAVAEKLSSGLLQAKLVACANIMPAVTSMYWWEGKIQKESELLVMLKTRSALFPQVSAFVKANHPYAVPEVIELPIQQGHKDYLQWIGENTKDPEADEE